MNNKGQTGWIILAIICIIGFMGVMFVVGSYNGLVGKDTNVEQKWGNVQTAYQRRADLIPNLVSTVKGYAHLEENIMTQVAEARSGVMNARTPNDLSLAGEQTNGIIGRLLAVVEAYPNLKSNENFMALQDELAGTENRIKWERDEYNIAVKDYKVGVRSFPGNIMAGIFGFDVNKWDTFAATLAAQDAPIVSFD